MYCELFTIECFNMICTNKKEEDPVLKCVLINRGVTRWTEMLNLAKKYRPVAFILKSALDCVSGLLKNRAYSELVIRWVMEHRNLEVERNYSKK